MAFPHTFGTLPTGNVPASYLDDNFNALGNISYVPCLAAGTNAITLSPVANTPPIGSYDQLQGLSFTAINTTTGAITIQVSPLAALPAYKPGTSAPIAAGSGDIIAGIYYVAVYDINLNAGAGGFHILNALPSTATPVTVPVRQTVLSGPVDTSGLPNFGGSTGSTTVTASGTLIATAANGFSASGQVNHTASIVNPSWTGLSTNGTMYLYLDITVDGVATTGSVTLAPVYQWGGNFSTTNNQHTFNIQQMQMQVGNGSTSAQVYRVFVGEVTVAGGVVTAIIWYALMGRYEAAFTNTLPGIGVKTSFTHNVGTDDVTARVEIKCITTDQGYAVGDIAMNVSTVGGSAFAAMPTTATRLLAYFTTGSAVAFKVLNATTGADANATAANWAYRMIVYRKW